VAATYFVDPPYVDKGRYYRFSDINYDHLADWSRSLPGRAIVCEQNGAQWLPFTGLASIKSTRGRSSEVAYLADTPTMQSTIANEQEGRTMPRGKKKEAEQVEETPDRLLELIDEQVQERLRATLAERAATKRITELASEARRKGKTQAEVAAHVQRVTDDGKLAPISRQALGVMVAVHDERVEPRTTRASRRRREQQAVGTLNIEALR
jgi:hypothetical protein